MKSTTIVALALAFVATFAIAAPVETPVELPVPVSDLVIDPDFPGDVTDKKGRIHVPKTQEQCDELCGVEKCKLPDADPLLCVPDRVATCSENCIRVFLDHIKKP